MSANNLTAEGEFRYIIQWFNEWSELQREDFVPVLVEHLLKDHIVNGGNGVYMNGVVNSMSVSGLQDKPMSLFQCRIKLFREWCPKWPTDLKYKLKEKIIEIDAKVGEKIFNELQHNGSHSNVNNGAVNSLEIEEHAATEIETAAEAAQEANAVNADSDAVADDNRLAAVLRQETPVDDDDEDEVVDSDNIISTQHGLTADDDCLATINGHYASQTTAAAVSATESTIIANPSPLPEVAAEQPVEQVENNVTSINASAISTAASNAEVPPVA